MTLGADAMRPDDRAMLNAALRELARRSGLPILYGGLIERNALTITELLGTGTDSLRRLHVQPGEGVGGAAFERARVTLVADYIRAPHISHQHDEAVRREGLRSMMAVPVVVNERARAVIYAATRDEAPLGELAADDVVQTTRRVAGEIRVRDEVDRRVSFLQSAAVEAPVEERSIREAVREAHSELLALASATADPDLAKTLRSITNRLLTTSQEVKPVAPPLTQRETAVLAQVALGATYAETARRLGLQADTVKGYMQTICRKLNAHSRHEAVVVARQLGLLP